MNGTNYLQIVQLLAWICLKTRLTPISGGRVTQIDEKCWTLDKPMASLSTCHLGLCLGWPSLHQNTISNVYRVCSMAI